MRPDVVTAALLLMCITVAAGYVPCDDGWSSIDVNRCVNINTSKNFLEAPEHCRTLNGDLVSLHGYNKMFMVICLTRRDDSGHQSIWISAQRSETKTENIDIDSRNCDGKKAYIKLNVKHWGSFIDVLCPEKKRFVCAKNESTSPADPDPPALQTSAVPDGPQPSPVPV